jgi:hypothetical protein
MTHLTFITATEHKHTDEGTYPHRHWHHQVATETAATLDGQTKQMEAVLDSLDEIHFSLKKANQVIRDITRRIATDKCVTMWRGCTYCLTVDCPPLRPGAPCRQQFATELKLFALRA